jgi:hypothetical protein
MPSDAPIDPNSDDYIQDSITNSGDYIKVPNSSFTTPVYFAASTDPSYTITPALFGPTVTVHIPTSAQPAPGTDSQLIIYDLTLNESVGLHHATFDTTWHADGTDRYLLDSEGLDEAIGGTPGNSGHRGVPAPIRALRYDEVQSGTINHRLECFWWATADSHVFPMSLHENNRGGVVPEGMVVRIKPSVDLDSLGLSSQALVIAKALQTYGCVVGDNSGSGNKLKIETNSNWNLSGTAFQAVPWSMWEFIQAGYNPVTEETVTMFRQGDSPDITYSGAIDTMIKESTPTATSGGSVTLQADGADPGSTGEDDSVLLRWYLGSIPNGSTVTSAKIVLNVTNDTNSTGYDLYELKRAWTEGGASWNQYASGSNWQTPGAEGTDDRGTTVLGTVAPTDTGTYALTLNSAGLAVVQNWISTPSSNHGFIITNSTNTDGLTFSSSEETTSADRPLLIINYTE